MKRIIITVLIISVAAVTQKTQGQSSEFKGLLFGFNISPDICYRTLKNNDNSSSSSMIIDLREKDEMPKIGYTAGLSAAYKFSSFIEIESGIQYSNKGWAIKKKELICADSIDPRWGFTPNSGETLPIKAKLRYNISYLDIPLRVIFHFGKSRVHFVSSIGLTTNILLKSTSTSFVEYENGDSKRNTENYPYDFKSLNFSPSVSAGVDFRIKNNINMRVEPSFQYGLLKTIDTPITAYWWNGGLNITCYYAFK